MQHPSKGRLDPRHPIEAEALAKGALRDRSGDGRRPKRLVDPNALLVEIGQDAT
jgi:hypothetical protein